MNYNVQVGIQPEHTESTARLYAQAFAGKFMKILGPPEEVIALFSKGINLERAVSAVSEGNELLGIAGFQLNQSGLVDVTFRDFTQHYGFLRGTIKFLVVAILFSRTPDGANQLLMDGIAVDASSRGMGIGKQLFAELEQFAKEQGMTSLKLDVIDENPNAKRLYEKIGFVAVKHKKVPKVLENMIGVSGVTTMVKKL